jgi:hypothetical protein
MTDDPVLQVHLDLPDHRGLLDTVQLVQVIHNGQDI